MGISGITAGNRRRRYQELQPEAGLCGVRKKAGQNPVIEKEVERKSDAEQFSE